MGDAMPEAGMAPRNVWARRVRERAPAPYAPDLDPDALDELADEIRVLAAHLHAGTRELLGLIARFDAAGGWKTGGHRGCENWLSLNTGVALRTARDYVRVARALEDLPETGASMGRGALSLCQVRALTRVATPETETDLLALAEGASTAVLERECRAWKTLGRKDEAERERALHASRRLALYPNGDGMHRLDALLMPETAATFGKAIDRARFALYRHRGEAEWDDDPAEIARRRADALGLVAEWALAFGSGSGSNDDPGEDDPISGTRAERFQVVLHVEHATLAAEGEPGRSELEDGTRLAAETARRLSCDCGIVRVERGPDGEVLNIGRKSRSLPPALRRALEVRDRGCRFPGCGLRFTDGHHLVHWADGGETSIRNTMLLCRVHHRLVHEGGWTVQLWGRDRHLVFVDPRGQAHGSFRPPPPSPLPDDPAGAIVQRNRARGVDPDADTAPARWQREHDVPDEVLFRALEATAPG